MIEYSPNLKLAESDKQFINNCLPQEWKTKIIQLYEQTKKELHININAKTIQDTYNWIESYEKLTSSCYSIESTKKSSITYKKYNCIHNTSTNNLNCPARISILLRKTNCEIKLRYFHNHSLNDPKLKKIFKVVPEIKNELYDMFELGYKPAIAVKYLKNVIKNKFGNKYACPNYSYVYKLYGNFKSKHIIFDNRYVDEWLQNLTTINLNELIINKNNVESTEDGFVISSPISKRIIQHEPLSSEIIFIETLHFNETWIFLFLTPSEVGCLPLGIIITTSNTFQTLHKAFTLFKKQLNDGPKIFVIDDSSHETIIQSIWPKSINIISAYHTLKHIWSWLTSAENKIPKDDQSTLFRDFYNILYAGNDYMFKKNYETAKFKKYETYNKLLDDYYNKKQLWGVCYRPQTIKSYTNIIKYSEITIWFLKHMLSQKLHNLSFDQICNFIINVFFQYIKQRLLDFTNKKLLNQFYCDINLPDEKILKNIQNIGQSLCFVPSENETNVMYAVNLSLCKCTCLHTSICKHIQWICKLNYTEKLYENLNLENRKKCYYIATGKQLKQWLIQPDQVIYKTTCDNNYKIQIIDEEDDDDVSSNTIKLDDNFVAGVFKNINQNHEMDETL